jgi:amino acid transporter
MAVIFFQSFGQKGTLAFWALVVLAQYMMGSSTVRTVWVTRIRYVLLTFTQLLASSRQIFAFSRDGALPASGWLKQMNTRTRTPVHAVMFSAVCSALLCLLVFAGPVAINAVFSLCVVAAYTAYSIPIVARFMCVNDFQPGPWNLGRWVSVLHSITRQGG